MSFTLHGIGVSGGIAIGYAHLVSYASMDVPHYVLPKQQLEEEVTRFDRAVRQTRNELESLWGNLPEAAPAELGAFLSLHLMILNDALLSKAPRKLIKEQQCNAEWALKQQLNELLAQFDEIEDSYLRERKADVILVVERVMKALQGQQQIFPPHRRPEEVILVAHDLSPADMVMFKDHAFSAFITDVGGLTSHTAILARSLDIPSVLALHQARQLIREDELMIVDGVAGVVIVDPDERVLREYQARQTTWLHQQQSLQNLVTIPASTQDDVAVELLANIELPEDVKQAKKNGAGGIGLFRSEFLFLGRDDLPDEEEQFAAYRFVAQEMEGREVNIRTLDLGADKNPRWSHLVSANPALGLRAIRLCLAEPQLFLLQLRAILRASHYGHVQLMLPMLSSVEELKQALRLVAQAKQQLRDQGVPFNEAIKVGGMIEVPAAALAIHALIRHLDFVSIGTNDLIQYTLAIDRSDDSVAHLYDPLHPAVLYLIAHTIKAADKAGVPVSVCGEVAGDTSLTRLLLGLGLRRFSMHPAHLLKVKRQVVESKLSSFLTNTQKILRVDDSEKVANLVATINAVS